MQLYKKFVITNNPLDNGKLYNISNKKWIQLFRKDITRPINHSYYPNATVYSEVGYFW